MSRAKKIGMALGGLMLSAGCFTTGKNFPTDVDWLIKGKTNQEDVELLLGSPTAVGNSGGERTWTYGHYQYSLWNSATYKELKIYWSPNRTVHDYSFTSSFPADIGNKANKRKAPAPQ